MKEDDIVRVNKSFECNAQLWSDVCVLARFNGLRYGRLIESMLYTYVVSPDFQKAVLANISEPLRYGL